MSRVSLLAHKFHSFALGIHQSKIQSSRLVVVYFREEEYQVEQLVVEVVADNYKTHQHNTHTPLHTDTFRYIDMSPLVRHMTVLLLLVYCHMGILLGRKNNFLAILHLLVI
jgi:hypothetical protein